MLPAKGCSEGDGKLVAVLDIHVGVRLGRGGMICAGCTPLVNKSLVEEKSAGGISVRKTNALIFLHLHYHSQNWFVMIPVVKVLASTSTHEGTSDMVGVGPKFRVVLFLDRVRVIPSELLWVEIEHADGP